jgi:hypothetical protein
MPLNRLNEFYSAMSSTVECRRMIVCSLLENNFVPAKLLDSLKQTLEQILSIPRVDSGGFELFYAEHKTMKLDLTYEIEELKKDIFFIKRPEEEFAGYLEDLHPGFRGEVGNMIEALRGKKFSNFITDRDGTVNNYCGRYRTSIQSAYNAFFLTRFARNCSERSILLSSAPLRNLGLVDISVFPSGTYIYAGSKGREYLDIQNRYHRFPVEAGKQNKLDILNAGLADLLKDPRYEPFSLIGSGLQFKFGQTTVSRQDINGSVPEKESRIFLRRVKKLVHKVDPEKTFFRIEDTGKDIEIILTVTDEKYGTLKDFDKGDGVMFLNRDVPLFLNEGVNLICGDTPSDVPMVEAASEMNHETLAVFVSEDLALQKKVTAVCPRALFVSEPDVLVYSLNELAK